MNTRRREFLRLRGWLPLGLSFALLLGLPGCWLKTSNFPEEMRAYRECLNENPDLVEACDEQHAKAAAEYDRYEREARQVFACPPDGACQPGR